MQWTIDGSSMLAGHARLRLDVHLAHSRSGIIRAILEGLAIELRQVIESFEEVGLEVPELRSTGGGAAILAGVGCKAYRDVDEGVQEIYQERDLYTPDRSRAGIYGKRYHVYKKVPCVARTLQRN